MESLQFNNFEYALIAGIIVFLISSVTGTFLTYVTYKGCLRLGAVDKPDGRLKKHSQPTANLGGLPVVAAVFLALVSLSIFSYAGIKVPAYTALFSTWPRALCFIVTATLIILGMGIKDDLHHVKPWNKFLFQLIAGVFLVVSGVLVRRIYFFDVFEISLGFLAIPFTLFWLTGACNAFNFIDGMDGLGAGVGSATSMVLAILGFLTHQYLAALICLSLAGALLGFLVFNIRPACIFLGDSGSQFIGLALGALSIHMASSQGRFHLPTAGLILCIPVYDTTLSILRRYSRYTSPLHGDCHHIHHCLRQKGLTVNQVSLTISVVSLFLGVIGIHLFKQQGPLVGLASLFIAVSVFYLLTQLGTLEISQLAGRLRERAMALSPGRQPKAGAVSEVETFWNRMKPFFEKMQLERAVLTLKGIHSNGRIHHKIFQWARSEHPLIERAGEKEWTREIALDGGNSKNLTLKLISNESSDQERERINQLIEQIQFNLKPDPLPSKPARFG